MIQMSAPTHLFPRPHRLALGGGLAVLAVAAAAAVGTGGVGAASITVLGASSQTALPSCPTSPCQAIGKTTGFQTAIGPQKHPFAAPSDGKIVAWSIKLSAPSSKPGPNGAQSQQDFFDQFYGGPPSARIAVLKPVRKPKGGYKLKAQGPVEQLRPYLGTTTTFTLRQPLTIRSGQIVALTVPTWAPAFAINLPKDVTWRGSRKHSACGNLPVPPASNKPKNEAQIKAGRAHEAPHTARVYGCSYDTARLLYSATYVKGPAPTKPTKRKK